MNEVRTFTNEEKSTLFVESEQARRVSNGDYCCSICGSDSYGYDMNSGKR
jgi:hypothetical protein